MTVTADDLTIRTTEKYDSLTAAREASMQRVASAIARAVRAGIDAGRYVVVDGVVKVVDASRIEMRD